MRHLISKPVKKTLCALLAAVIITALNTQPANAAINCNLQPLISSGEEPSPSQLLCPIARGLNLIVLISGAIFTIMLGIAAFKYAMAQGDPKGLQGAKDTLVLAVMGFVVVLFLFSISIIIGNIFGLDTAQLGPISPFNALYEAMRKLFRSDSAIPIVTDP